MSSVTSSQLAIAACQLYVEKCGGRARFGSGFQAVYVLSLPTKNKKKKSVALVSKRTIPTERPPLVGEVIANFWWVEGVAWSEQRIPTAVKLSFLDRSRYFFIQVIPKLSSRGWVDPVSEPLLLRKFGTAENRTRDLWICNQKLWPLEHRGGH
jgi:hypothetical protein